MNVYLAGTNGMKQHFLNGDIDPKKVMVLESFFSMQEWQKPLLSQFRSFLLDSGAFTFMSNSKKHGSTDWEAYTDAYCDFINEYKIKLFFEMDIDVIKGIDYVEKLRRRIEQRTGRQPIPVWHISRGKQYFIDMCKEYPYVAFGGILTDGVRTSTIEKAFPWFIKTAHQNKAKIHGLGYTNIKGIHKYHFDSVDSTTWTSGARFGALTVYRNGWIKKIASVESGVKVRSLKDTKEANWFNFREWVKFQHYAEENL